MIRGRAQFIRDLEILINPAEKFDTDRAIALADWLLSQGITIPGPEAGLVHAGIEYRRAEALALIMQPKWAGTVIRTVHGGVLRLDSVAHTSADMHWSMVGTDEPFYPRELGYPVDVLWAPDAS